MCNVFNFKKEKDGKKFVEMHNDFYLMHNKDGEPYVVFWSKDGFISSRCHKDEKFDAEKGILVCISKFAGYKYSDIKEKLSARGFGPDNDDVEKFYLYDIAYNSFGVQEDDIKELLNGMLEF